jgi:hypothetical protein
MRLRIAAAFSIAVRVEAPGCGSCRHAISGAFRSGSRRPTALRVFARRSRRFPRACHALLVGENRQETFLKL